MTDEAGGWFGGRTVRYPVKLSDDDNGTMLVGTPDFPEVATFGDDREDALARAVDAVETALMGRIAAREDIPRPGKAGKDFAVLPALTAAKLSLYWAMKDERVGKAALARKLGWHMPQVDRLLDLSHASKLDAIEAALAVLGRTLEIKVQKAA